MTKSKKLRDMLNKEGVIRIIGAHDGITSKLVEMNNFDGVFAGGLEISTSYAVPHANILTMTQYLQTASVMNDAVSIPIIADCNTGYGNSNNVIYMVKKYESTGIAAVTIGDKKFPKVNSISGRQELAPIAEFVGKILAAKNTQESKEFMLIAKVEALTGGWGEEEALKRAHAYIDAGADAILIDSKSKMPDEIINFAKSWDFSAPLVIIPTSYPMTIEEINQLGIKMVIYENQGLRSSIKAINDVLSEIKKEGRLDTINDKMVSMGYFSNLQGMEKYEKNGFLWSDEEPIKVIIPAAGAPRNQESLEALLQDRPIAMLDIWGKSILQRNVEILNRSNLYDIFVIKGYKGDSFNIDGITYLDNPKYLSEHILSSIMQAKDIMNTKTLIIYSDILFENHLIDRLKSLRSDFVIVIDNSFKNHKHNKKLEIVLTEENLPSGNRILIDRLYKVNRIGDSSSEDVNYSEFIGACMFSKKGIEILKNEYNNAIGEYSNRQFYKSKNIFQASLTDMLQHLIFLGYKVNAIQVNSGWMEIHTFDNYKNACSIIR
ncbi:MAG: isocitrate lyase/phosphoenolpyruvate mutase family protein [Candidatus Methanoperedens sp.]